MNRIELLKKLLPGFLPLFVFILADELWGTRAGLLVALVFGIGQMGFVWLKEKRFDRFILTDTLLLIALGGISILLDNELFFKLKPALIELILCAVLGVSVFSSKNLMLLMTKRYLRDVNISPQQEKQMTQSLKIMFFIFLAHTALVFYSAYFMSKEAWAFISGGLFYLIFGIYFVFELLRNKLKAKKQQAQEEWLPLVRPDGKVVGKAPRSLCHTNPDLLHPVVHLHLVNNRKQLFLQKRPETKDIQPGKWDTAVGGHIALNEDLQTALLREAQEELQISDFQAQMLKPYVWKSPVESELVHVFVARYDKPIEINPQELAGGRFWSIREIEKNIGKHVFTPNFEHEFSLLKPIIFRKKAGF